MKSSYTIFGSQLLSLSLFLISLSNPPSSVLHFVPRNNVFLLLLLLLHFHSGLHDNDKVNSSRWLLPGTNEENHPKRNREREKRTNEGQDEGRLEKMERGRKEEEEMGR